MESKNPDSIPWKNGYYRMKGLSGRIYCVEEEAVTMETASGKPTNSNDPSMKGTWKYGDFGEAHPDVVKETGKKNYNVEIILYVGRVKMHAVVNDDGRKLTFYGLSLIHI